MEHGNLIDPTSAVFRNVTHNGPRTVWCGEVKAKNRFGGYVGWAKFDLIVGKHVTHVEVLRHQDPIRFADEWDEWQRAEKVIDAKFRIHDAVCENAKPSP